MGQHEAKCPQHGRKWELYCETCEIRCCTECVPGHSEHRFLLLSDVMDTKLATLEESLSEVQLYLQQYISQKGYFPWLGYLKPTVYRSALPELLPSSFSRRGTTLELLPRRLSESKGRQAQHGWSAEASPDFLNKIDISKQDKSHLRKYAIIQIEDNHYYP